MKENQMVLAQMEPGTRGIVTGLTEEGSIRQRLEDLGFVDGAPVACVEKSPLGDPCAYRICGAIIALRQEDACRITVAEKA